MDKGGNVNMEKKISSSILYDSEGNAIIRIQVTDNKFIATAGDDGRLLLTADLDDNGYANGEEVEYTMGMISAKLHFKHGCLNGKQEMLTLDDSGDNDRLAKAYYKDGVFVKGDYYFEYEMPVVKNMNIEELESIVRSM